MVSQSAQLYGIFEIPGWIYANLRFHTSYKDFSENQQFCPVYEKLSIFSFVLSVYTECNNKVACSKDVPRHDLFRKCSVSKKSENSWTCILQAIKPAFWVATQLNNDKTGKFNCMFIKCIKKTFSAQLYSPLCKTSFKEAEKWKKIPNLEAKN